MLRLMVGLGWVVTACGGPTHPDAQGFDASVVPDANASCVTPDAYPGVGAFAESEQFAEAEVDGGASFLGFLATGTPQVAMLSIFLVPGRGAFAGMTQPAEGTYSLTGAEVSQSDCGICVYLSGAARIDSSGRVVDFDEAFFGDSGTVTITRFEHPFTFGGAPDAGVIDGGMLIDAASVDASASSPRLAGSVAGLTFHQISPMTSEPVPGGCRSAFAGGSFDTTVDPP